MSEILPPELVSPLYSPHQGEEAVVFISSASTRTISETALKTKTTGQPSVNLFGQVTADYPGGESPARKSTPHVFLPRADAFSEIVYQPDTAMIAPAPVTKPKVEPVTAPVTTIVPVNQPAIDRDA